MKWILTNQASSKYKKYDINHNQNLLEKSILDCTEEDKRKLELLLNMIYIEYLNFFTEETTVNIKKYLKN